MAKTATVKIGDRVKPVMVRELTLAELNELLTAPERPWIEAIANLLGLCSDIEPGDLMPHSPSEIKPLVEKLLELNQDFFDQAAAIQMEDVAADMKQMISRISMLAFLRLSPPATENESGNTPTECSSTP